MNSLQPLVEKMNRAGATRMPFFAIINFEGSEFFFSPLEALQHDEIQIDFPGFKFHEQAASPAEPLLKWQPKPQPFAQYQKSFDTVLRHLRYGNSFLTNLTASTPLETSASLSSLFHAAQARYKIQYKQDWLCFSPETFVQIHDGRIFAYPMKGTIDAAIPNAETVILNDEKETAEHYTIVDLIRNDLSRVATQVVVEDFRYIDTLHTAHKTLLQVSSRIAGNLPHNHLQHLGDIFLDLLPAGSISGAPKLKTLDIIREAETHDRGYYTGVAIYFDGSQVDSCVLIRFIERMGDGFVYKSGGGMTIHSDAENEYQELIDKIYVPIYR